MSVSFYLLLHYEWCYFLSHHPTLPPLHSTEGTDIRCSSTLTVHVNTSCSPAVALVGPEMITSGFRRSEKNNQKLLFQECII